MNERSKWRSKAENACVRIEAYTTKVDFSRPDIKPRQQGATGTGFFVPSRNIDMQGGGIGKWYSILTCAHVVDGCHADEISVIFPKVGRQRFNKNVVIQAVCPQYDLATLLIRIDDPQIQSNIQTMDLADNMPVGCSVSAFGYPLGQFGLTGSSGEYGAFQKGQYQHNADISPGNSGGPLVRNDTGECVGVNASTIYGGAASGVHYAVPIGLYMRLSKQLLNGSRMPISPPRLGVCYHTATNALIEKISNEAGVALVGGGNNNGAYVHYVFKTSAAAKLGITTGSLLKSIEWETGEAGKWSNVHHLDRHGETLTSFSGSQKVGLQYLLERIPIDSKIKVTMIKKNEDGTHALTTSEGTMEPFKDGSYRFYSSPLEEIPDYCFFAGICVMRLCANHADNFPGLFQKLSPAQREMDNLVVTATLPNYSDIPFTEGSIIQFVNGKGSQKHFEASEERMDTLEKYRKALCNNNGYIEIVTTKNQMYTLKLADVVERENVAQKNNIYTPDPALLQCLKIEV